MLAQSRVLFVGGDQTVASLAAALEERGFDGVLERVSFQTLAPDQLARASAFLLPTDAIVDPGSERTQQVHSPSRGSAPRDRSLEHDPAELSAPVVVYGDGTSAATALDRGATAFVHEDAPPEAVAERLTAVIEDQRAHHRYESLFETAPRPIGIFDPSGRLEYVNEAACSLGGVDEDDLVGTPLWELPITVNASGNPTDTREAFQRALAGDLITLASEVADTHGTPHEMTLTVRPLFVDDDVDAVAVEAEWIDGLSADMYGRVDHHLNELVPISQRLRTIVDNVPIVVFALDADGVFTVSEGRGLDALGLAPGEAVGASVFDLYADYPDLLSAIERALDGEAFNHTADLGDVAFETWYRPIERNGEVRGVLGAAVDVTELTERERELRRQNERLENFASVVSHDLRNPLSAARGYASLLSDDYNEELLDDLQRSLDRMGELIDDLLALARSGQTVTDPEPTALAAVASKAWGSVSSTDGTLHLTIDGQPHVEADRSRLRELFENLYRNAVEHTSQPVTVTVGILAERQGFYVADNGPGIPAADRERVFEHGVSTKPDGTGLGLSIVDEIASAHGWTVSIADSEDEGARFEFTDVSFVE